MGLVYCSIKHGRNSKSQEYKARIKFNILNPKKTNLLRVRKICFLDLFVIWNLKIGALFLEHTIIHLLL